MFTWNGWVCTVYEHIRYTITMMYPPYKRASDWIIRYIVAIVIQFSFLTPSLLSAFRVCQLSCVYCAMVSFWLIDWLIDCEWKRFTIVVAVAVVAVFVMNFHYVYFVSSSQPWNDTTLLNICSVETYSMLNRINNNNNLSQNISTTYLLLLLLYYLVSPNGV